MAVAVVMPRQGQSVETCIITRWHKSKGEKVNAGEILFSYETDKAAFEFEAQESGVLLDVFFDEGDEVPVLETVAIIGSPGEKYDDLIPAAAPAATGLKDESPTPGEAAPEEAAPEEAPPEEVGPETAGTETEGAGAGTKIRISPLAKKLAGSLGIPIRDIKGTGPKGRIIERDIRSAAGRISEGAKYVTGTGEQLLRSTDPPGYRSPTTPETPITPRTPTTPTTPTTPKTPGTPTTAPEAPPTDAGAPGDSYKIHKLSNMRKIIARRMLESLQNSAQLTHHMSADARKLLAWRKELKQAAERTGKPDITINDLVCYAVIRALKKHPYMNAHFMGEGIRIFDKVHLGIAVDTERGLMVPVVRNADDMNVVGLAGRIRSLAEECRKGNIEPGLLDSEAAGFTVTNLGAYGVEMFTPVLNLPQVGILGVNTITYRPSDIGDGAIGFIPVIGLSLTYDHRAVDGAPASVFLAAVKKEIENIESCIQ